MDVSWMLWGGFVVFILAMLALDLGVFHRKAHEVSLKEALSWIAVWVSLAMIFNLMILLFWDKMSPEGATRLSNQEAAMAFLAGYLVEEALSVDNIFVFLLVFAYFKTPRIYQHRVLFYGILGALIFRATFIGVGVVIIHHFFWTTLILGVFLIFTGARLMFMDDRHIDPEANPAVRLLRRIMPVTTVYHGHKFFIREGGKLCATPLFVTLIFLEVTDVIFAVDSIPAIFAITTEPFIVFTSNVFAILGLRSLFFALEGLMQLFHYLNYGLSLVLVFVGGKMVYNYAAETWFHDTWGKFPIAVSLGVIASILTISIVASILWPPAKKDNDPLVEALERQIEKTHESENV